MKLPTVELTGPPAAMGESFGEQFKEQIRQFAARRLEQVTKFVALHDSGRRVTRHDILEAAATTRTAHESYDASIWAEFQGIARAAGLTIDELLVGNGLTDLRDLILFENRNLAAAPQAHYDECTAFIVPPSCADADRTISGQTWDMHADAMDYMVMVRRRPDDGPSTLGLTTVGCLCLIAMNEEGVAVGNTNLVPTDARVGVNYLFTITRALRCRSAAEAAEVVEKTPRLSGHNFYLADADGGINVECTATRTRRTPVATEPFVHANHYIDPELGSIEYPRDMASSRWRHGKMEACFAAMERPVTADACWERLAEVSQACVPHCNHEAGADDLEPATVATVVMRPGAGKLDVCAGTTDAGQRQRMAL
jgi:isopenicillin-N N-acyltransferase-like protein